MIPKIRVAINGYGVIGKRIADAVALQDDMELVGIVDVVIDNALYFNYQVYNQAIVVPETIDAIRALTGIVKDATVSINKTNHSLGILHGDIFKDISK